MSLVDILIMTLGLAIVLAWPSHLRQASWFRGWCLRRRTRRNPLLQAQAHRRLRSVSLPPLPRLNLPRRRR